MRSERPGISENPELNSLLEKKDDLNKSKLGIKFNSCILKKKNRAMSKTLREISC